MGAIPCPSCRELVPVSRKVCPLCEAVLAPPPAEIVLDVARTDVEELARERKRLAEERAELEADRARDDRKRKRSRRAKAQPAEVKRDPRLAVILTLFLGAFAGWGYARGCAGAIVGFVVELVVGLVVLALTIGVQVLPQIPELLAGRSSGQILAIVLAPTVVSAIARVFYCVIAYRLTA